MQLRDFTREQLRQAGKAGFISPKQRSLRKNTTAYPIDNKPPSTHSDRDDAIGIPEKLPDGGYLVHIHIADVAAHIARDSALDKGALERSFTRYRPTLRDPMFPMELSEGRMSLEDDTERLALTISVRLDKHCRPVGIEFSRTMLRSEAHDYEMAAGRIRTPGDPFQLMGKVASAIRHPKKMMATYDARTGLKVDAEGIVSFIDPSYLPITSMVETYMVLANRKTAEFAHEAGLPFLFRNHGAAIRGEDQNRLIHSIREVLSEGAHLSDKDRRKEMKRIMNRLDIRRATYAPEMKGHLALNLADGYAHFTSPIRRYADLVNQRMIHYAIDQIEILEQHILEFAEDNRASCDTEKVHTILWENAAMILRAVTDAKHSGRRRYPGKLYNLERTLEMAVEDILPSMDTGELAEMLADELLKRDMPYTKKDLKTIAGHINKEARAERRELQNITLNKASHWVKMIFPRTNARKLAAFSPNFFSALLEEVAEQGLMNDVFHREVLQRFDNHKLNLAYDTYCILIVAKEQNSELWRSLKKRALRELQKDGLADISHVFSTAQNNKTVPEETDIIEGMFKHGGTGETLHAARVVTEMEGRSYSAAHYSLAYTDKGARKRAIYDFICSFTFNELVPMEEAVLPSKHYAELGSHKAPVVLERIARETGMKLESSQHIARGQVYFSYSISGTGLKDPLHSTRHAATQADAQRKAARDILRQPAFKRAAAEHSPVSIEFGRTPEAIFDEVLRQHDLTQPVIEYREFKDANTGKRRFEASMLMEIPGQTPFIVSRDSAIKRLAKRSCCRDALAILRSMGFAEEDANVSKDSASLSDKL